MGSIVGRSTTLDIFHCKSLRHLVEVSSLTEDCRHGVPLVRRKEDLEQRGGEDIGIDDALTGESLDQNLPVRNGKKRDGDGAAKRTYVL